MDAKTLHQVGTELFEKRSSLLMLWQEVAENFYPERADFTYTRTLGTDFAANLTTSYPVLCRRDLGDQTGMMLRPTAKPWFHTGVEDGREDNDAKRWLQRAERTMRRAMYDKKSLFTKATKQGDHDFATFGQCAISVRTSRDASHLLYQCWHLRDVAWAENDEGQIGMVFRRWKLKARDMKRLFGDRVSDRTKALLVQNKPNEEVECMHMVVDADMYDDKPRRDFPYWSIYYEAAAEHVLEAVSTWNQEYVIPRWETVSGSQYAYSPATVAALPDARLLQAMTYTLLEAGEKVVNPPMIATQDVVRSDVSIFAGGITWVDRDYDEKLGEALRAMNIDSKGMPLGMEMVRDVRALLNQAFYLNKLTLPQRAAEMTAYEVGQRIQEYIRGALPLFEPMEMEYNGAICERTFEILRRHGAFGSMQDLPESLHDADVQFHFESPLHDAIEELEGQKFLNMSQYIGAAVALDPNAAAVPDVLRALRDALNSTGTPARWMRSETNVEEMVQRAAHKAEQQALLGSMTQGSEVVKNLAGASKDRAAAAVV